MDTSDPLSHQTDPTDIPTLEIETRVSTENRKEENLSQKSDPKNAEMGPSFEEGERECEDSLQGFHLVNLVDEDTNTYEVIFNEPVMISEFFSTEVRCKIKERKTSKKLLVFKQVNFAIETSPFGWCVERSVLQFAELQETLKTMLPFVLVPPFSRTEFDSLETSEDPLFFQQRYLENFLTALMNNPYTKCCKLTELFLNSDFYKSDVLSFKQTLRSKPSIGKLLSPDPSRPPKALEAYLKTLVSFRQKSTIKTNYCTIQLANTVHEMTQELLAIDNKLIETASSIETQFTLLSSKLAQFIELSEAKAKIKTKMESSFDLNYGSFIKSGDTCFTNFVGLLKKNVEAQSDFFSKTFFADMQFMKSETEFFHQYRDEIIRIRGQVNDRTAREPPEIRERDKEDLQIFKAYLTSMINFSFKHLFVFKNKWHLEFLKDSIVDFEKGVSESLEELAKQKPDVQRFIDHLPNQREFLDIFIQMSMLQPEMVA